MKKRFVLAYVLAAFAATGLHFAYQWLPLPLVGLLAPVRESVWEHLKLLYWPFLCASFILGRKTGQPERFWGGMLAALLGMPALLLGVYYTLSAGFGAEALWLDVTLFYLILAGGFRAGYRLAENGKCSRLAGVLVILSGLYGAALILFTAAPPELPVFIEKIIK